MQSAVFIKQKMLQVSFKILQFHSLCHLVLRRRSRLKQSAVNDDAETLFSLRHCKINNTVTSLMMACLSVME